MKFHLTIEADTLEELAAFITGKKTEKKPDLTLEQVREKAAALRTKDPEKFKELLIKYSVKKVPALEPSQYQGFYDDAMAGLA